MERLACGVKIPKHFSSGHRAQPGHEATHIALTLWGLISLACLGTVTPMTKPASPTKPAQATDWEAIERDYRAGILTLRQIGIDHGVSHTAINKRAARDCWVRGKPLRAQPVPLGDAATTSKADTRGFLYVIYMDDSAGHRYFKIGLTATFTARFGVHQCASPFPLHVACAYFVGDMRAEERYLHERFSEKRIRGEWFSLSNDDLSIISERALLVDSNYQEEVV